MNFWERQMGLTIPYIGKRRLPCNRDGTMFDSGEVDLLDEKAPFYVDVWVFEWLGFGFPLWPWAEMMDAKTGQPVE